MFVCVHVCMPSLWDVIKDLSVMTGVVGFHHSRSEEKHNLYFLYRAVTAELSVAVPPPPSNKRTLAHIHTVQHVGRPNMTQYS